MTTFADAAKTIRAKFEAQWPVVRPGVPVLWPNEVLNPVPDPNEPTNGQNGWAAYELKGDQEEIIAYVADGNGLYRQHGEVIIRCFVPVTSGEELLRNMVADACAIFRGWQNGDIKFYQVSTGLVGGGAVVDFGNWCELDARARFSYDLAG